MNVMLRKTSDNLIDLIEQMLGKDANSRISMLEIFDHPWIKKYNKKDYSSHSNTISSDSCSDEILSDIDEPPLFNIQEHENETTGNFVPVNLKPSDEPKKKKQKTKRHISFSKPNRLFIGSIDKR